MKIHQVIDATERRKNELKNTLKEIEASLIQSKTVDETIKAQMQRLIERTSLELQNLESQLHDAHDIDYVEFTQTQALPAFEETATVFYINLDDLLRRPTPYETRPKKVGKISHKLTFGLLNKHGIAGWPKDPNEHLSFAFVCTDAPPNTKLTSTSVLQLRDSTGRTIAMDVEPNYAYIGGYGRKTFLDVSILNRYESGLEVWAYVSPKTNISQNQIAEFCLRTIKQTLGFVNETVSHLLTMKALLKSVKPVPPQKKQSVSSKDQAALSADFHKFTGDIQRLLESASSNIHTAKTSMVVASIE